MKKNLLLFSLLIFSYFFAYPQQNPIIILDAKKIGFMQDLKKEMEDINPNDISTVTVLKDSIVSKKYESNFGVIIITTKKYILDTFYKNNIFLKIKAFVVTHQVKKGTKRVFWEIFIT